jgi:CHAD domain-containing protein
VKQAARRQRVWRRVGRSALEIRQDARNWTPEHRQFGCLAASIRSTHQRGQKAMAGALESQAAGDFHELRKQVKALWYELRLVERCSPRIRRDVNALRHAEEWLGAEHDLVVLCDELSHGAPRAEQRFDLERVRVVAAAYQRQLRDRALADIRPIYAQTSRGYADSVRDDWQTWRVAGGRRAVSSSSS